jgi:hypothetical protein
MLTAYCTLFFSVTPGDQSWADDGHHACSCGAVRRYRRYAARRKSQLTLGGLVFVL